MTIGSAMSFDPAHARLRKKATRQLKQSTAEQLEHETKKMEERIRSLKEQMTKEKEEREKIGGSRWVSGKAGPLSSHSQQVTKKKPMKSDKGPRKIKLLSDEPLSTYTKKSVLRESLNESFGSDLRCGQCEKTKATLSCVECTENYCVGCFMGFHRKGALRSHTTRNLDQSEPILLEEKERTTAKRTKVPASRRVQNSTSPEQKTGGALFHGTYDEKASAESFARALQEWRTSKKKENTWVNPADEVKVSSVSCETSTSPEKVKPVEINLNFGANKCMSYLDRLVLKKHRESDPVTAGQRTPSREKNWKTQTKKNSPPAKTSNDRFGINYREIFQSIGVHSARTRSSCSPSYCRGSAVTIEEITDSISNTAETTSCIVEENSILPDSVRTKKASPRSGRVSIQGMTAYGVFRDNLDDAAFSSPKSSLGGPIRNSNSPYRTKSVGHRGVSPVETSRVWSPKTTYTGLSDFFLAGVKSQSPSNSPNREILRTSVSPKLLAKGVWKPSESVCITDVTCKAERDIESSITLPYFSVIPFVHEPQDDVDNGAGASNNHVQKSNSIELDMKNMQDFGINDFLKAVPVPRKLSGDYCNVHRVSTVSPLTLTPHPPQLHWSDDDSDDDAIVDAVSRVSDSDIKEARDKEQQENDDRVTLEDLTWELASTTGRLTQCEGGLGDSLDNEDGEDSGNEDSIEEDNGGASLSDDSSDEIDREDVLLANSLMREEVHALK